MKNVNPVGWFEIPVANIFRAKKFYETILKESLNLDEMRNWKLAWFPKSVKNEYGATGALIEGSGYTPSLDGVLIYFSVSSIEDTLKLVEISGGQTLLQKMKLEGHGYIAKFEDCEGNRIALHSMT